ncbi:PUB2, partial [Symbiodinium necroappetens]
EWAAAALGNLAVSADNQALIAEAGAIPPLVELLRSSGDYVRGWAAEALGELAKNAGNKALIAEPGGIPPLVSCLTTGTDITTRHFAAQALGHLMADWIVVDGEFVPMPEATEIAEANQASIASAGAIEPLIALLLTNVRPALQAAAAQALRPFSSREDTRVAIVEAGGISVLAKLLTRCEPAHQHGVVGILDDLAENVENVAAIVEAEAVPGLVELMGDRGTDRGQEAAAELLLKLCAHPQGLSEAKASGALDVAAELETSGTPAAQEAAKRLVALLRPGR